MHDQSTAHASLESNWHNPEAIWRDAPFWSWNGRLTPERLARQIDRMQAAGFGGFFMHSRYGLQTPYLSDEWFDCIKACIDKARQTNMLAYLYDEDRWPSGSAAGSVTRAHPEYRLTFLVRSDERPADDAEHVATFALTFDSEGKLISYGPAEHGTPGAESYWRCPDAPDGWFNDGTYLDTMDPDAVDAFIASTYELYAERVGDAFGNTSPAFFTDEVHHGQVRDSRHTQWTRQMEQAFRDRWGYELIAHLPELFHPLATGEFSRVRYHYRRTIAELFAQHFTGRIAAWCDTHGIALTGHLLEEETLNRQCNCIGSAMPHYEHMQWPGIDVLGDAGDDKLVMTKQCTSVADQLGKERTLSELYGGAGWDWPLEGHKYVGDWHAVLGINFRCVHLVHYSLAGGAKRDWLPSQGDHNAWGPYYRMVEDYFARLNFMLSRGTPRRDVLIVHPIDSAWGCYLPKDGWVEDSVARMGYGLHNLGTLLMGEHRDWDYVDESLLPKYASVSGDAFSVGRMTYRLVVVPPSVTLRRSTVDALRTFVDGGGEVLFVGRVPHHIDGEPDDDLAALATPARCCSDEDQAVRDAVNARLTRQVSIQEGGRKLACVWAMLREVDGGRLLFMQSHDREHEHTATVSLPLTGTVVMWDPASGIRTQVDTDAIEDGVTFSVELPPTGSALLSIGMDVPTDAPRATPIATAGDDATALAGPYAIRLTEPNTLPLDFCAYQFGDDAWSDAMPVLKVDRDIRARFGQGARLGREHQPWYLYAQGAADTTPRGPLTMRWACHITDVPSSCRLMIESPDRFAITVNGQPAPPFDDWWVDEDFPTADIASLLKAGDNEITLAVTYSLDVEIEGLVLLGDFGVALRDATLPATHDNYTIVAPPHELACGSWVGQGLDFFGGGVRYRVQLPDRAKERGARIAIPGPKATAVAVHAGSATFAMPWQPFAADISAEDVKACEGVIEVEIIGGRRNTLGGQHMPGSGSTDYACDHTLPQWTDAYVLSDHGLMQPPVVRFL